MENNLDIEQQLNILFLKLGFNLYTKGVLYLKQAIILSFKNNDLLYTYDYLLNLIGSSYNLSSHAINNAIAHSLTTMFTYNEKKVQKIFGELYDDRKPSPKYFITLCIE